MYTLLYDYNDSNNDNYGIVATFKLLLLQWIAQKNYK